MMREDIISGILELYGYKDAISENDALVKVRDFMRGVLSRKGSSPWLKSEKVILEEILKTLQGGSYTEEEALDVAITCVYDVHRLGWDNGCTD